MEYVVYGTSRMSTPPDLRPKRHLVTSKSGTCAQRWWLKTLSANLRRVAGYPLVAYATDEPDESRLRKISQNADAENVADHLKFLRRKSADERY